MEGVDSAEAQGVAEMPTDFNGAKTLSTYLGISFAVFLGFLPRASISLVSALQFQNRNLSFNLFQAEEQLKQMKTRRAEDAKANAKVVEIFASHRSNWQKEEKRLLQQIEALTEESVLLKKKITEMMKSKEEFRVFAEKLQRDVDDREEVIHLISKKHEEEKLSANEVFASLEKMKAGEVASETEFQALRCQNKGSFGRNAEENGEIGDYGTDFSRIGRIRVSQGLDESGIGILKKERRVPLLPEFLKGISMENDGAFGLEQPSEACFWERNRESDALAFLNGQTILNRDLLPTPSKVWMERSSNLQDLQYDSLESLYQMKHYVARRESPWKVDGESTGVSSKLKLLEQELLNLERIGKPELAKVPSLMRKLAKRYQGLAGKIDDLCRRMQASDPSEPNISSEFRTQRQTEFLLETFRLQQRAIEAGQKLTALHAEIAPSRSSDELGSQVNLSTRRSLSSIKNNFKEIQRNLEIWLARIMGDLEGILARDGMSRVSHIHLVNGSSIEHLLRTNLIGNRGRFQYIVKDCP